MKKIFFLLATATVLLNACKDKTTTEPDPVEETTLTGSISENRTLKSGNTYTLKGFVYVKNGATLTIEPGVTILGEKASKGTLIVTRNGKINAEGTNTNPIVFTSDQADGSKNIGDWGGVILLGKATNNGSYNGTSGLMEIEGGVNNTDGDGLHGGTDDNDNTGTLKYVRIEFAGIAFQPNSEINGLTCGSVGRGTTLEYIQVSYCGDDAFEFFGGTVNCKYLVSYRNTDDDIDTDFGYRGNIQFAIVARDPALADEATGGASNGFESDNDASGSSNAPFTSPVLSNITIIGPKQVTTTTVAAPYKRGNHIRRNSRLSLFNSVIMGWPTGLLIDGSTTSANATNNDLKYAKNTVAGWSSKAIDTASAGGSGIAPYTWYLATNDTLTNNTQVGITNAFDLLNFNPCPTASSPLITVPASFTDGKLNNAFFTAVTYRGACATNATWYKNWTKFFNK
ncbi:MAG: hypothetical protein KA275_06860 [Chitinophagaceae bacterium]|nr:hypothetical protein [Chitinophagaceae bacterium]